MTDATVRLHVDGLLVDEQAIVLGVGGTGLIGDLGARHGDLCRGAEALGLPWLIEIEFADGEHVRWGTDARGMVEPVPVDDLAAAIERQQRERHPDGTPARPPSPCPTCGKVTDAATGATPDSYVPDTGDASVCFYCGALAVFTATGLRHPTDAERAEMLADPGVVAAVGAVLAYRATDAE